MVKLNVELNRLVEVVCPKCGHKHRRHITNGVVKEDGRFNGNVVEEICPTIAAWSETPRTKVMQKVAGFSGERDGAVVKKESDLVVTDIAQMLLRESWEERFADKV
jgi:hypothetical protein